MPNRRSPQQPRRNFEALPHAGAARVRASNGNDILWSIAAVTVAALVCSGLQAHLSLTNLSMIFLLAVLLTAVVWGMRASVIASILSVAIYDFFFVPPFYTFTISSSQDVLALLVFLVVAILTSNLTGRVRDQAEAARRREATTAALYDLSREIAGAVGLEELLHAIVRRVARIMNAQVVVLFPDRDRLAVEAAEPGDTILNEGELAAAMWAWRNNQPAGRGADMLHGAKWLHMPLRSTTQTIGVLALCFDSPEAVALPEQRRLLDALIDQAIVAIERARLAHDIEQAKLLSERERLQAIFLSSVSHDLRTPLASIIGAASSLLDGSEAYDERTRRDLLATIQEEAERLNRFVGNLLDTTRLESGSLKLNREWVEINDVIGAALAQLSSRLAGRGVNVVVEPGLPMLRLDFVLMQQVFINLFENAAKYSGEGEPIRIAARRDGEAIRIDVEDRGVGIPASDIELIFDKFYRVQRGDRQIAGTGLGLSICRGIVEEHDGKIVAESPIAEGKGTRFSVLFPIEKESPVLEGTEAAD